MASRETQMFCDSCCDVGDSRSSVRTWLNTGASASQFSSFGGGTAYNMAAGVERDLQGYMPWDGTRSAAGLFGFTGQAQSHWLTGNALTDNYGLGGYLRSSLSNGLYGSFVGSVSNANTDLVNHIFNSTGSTDSVGYSLVGSVGKLTPLTDATSFDVRQFISYGNVNGDSFSTSTGMIINDTRTDILTVGSMIGLNHAISDRGTAYVRGGVKWYDIDRSLTVGATTLSGSSQGWVPSASIGMQYQLTERTSIDLSGYGDWTQGLRNDGGNLAWIFQF